jgi:energy-coupling factor transporter ATP-binding protein EcfA2
MLSTAVHEDLKQGIKFVVLSREGCGKSTFMGSLNNTLYCAAENGYLNLDKKRNTVIPISDYQSLLSLFGEVAELIANGTNTFENITIDSLSSIERMMTQYVISSDPKMVNDKSASINTCHKGYGNGAVILNKEWCSLLHWLDYFSSCGINILCAAHSVVTQVKKGEYSVEHDFIDILLNAPTKEGKYGGRHLVQQWSDCIAYLYISEPNEKGERNRVLDCVPNDSYYAKNRLDIDEKITIPRHDGWNAFAEVVLRCYGKDYRVK